LKVRKDSGVYLPLRRALNIVTGAGMSLTLADNPAQDEASLTLAAITTTTGIWRLDTTTTMSDPGSGKFRFNNAAPASATQLAISKLTDPGTDASPLLKALASGDGIYIQDQNNSANFVRYDINGAVTNNTTWFQIPVALHGSSSGGSMPTNNTQCLIQFTTGGGGAVAGTVTSVALTMPTGEFSVTGSPVTSSGTLAAAWQSQSANLVLAAPAVSPGPPLFRSLVAADLPVFVAAGSINKAGAVPAPGSTAHANVPRLLADTAAFVQPGGKTLGFLATGTDQSTSSTTAVDLTTKDEVTFTIDENTTVNILWTTGIYHDTAGKNAHDDIVVDNGSGYGASIFGTDYYLATALGGATLTMLYQYAFTGTGTRKVKVMHSNVNGGGNCHWRSRSLLVWVA